MARNLSRKSHTISTKLSDSEEQLLRDYCAARGLTPAALLRDLLLRELSLESPSEPDSAAALLRLFVATMQASLEEEDSPNALTMERFEILVEDCAPWVLEPESGEAQSA